MRVGVLDMVAAGMVALLILIPDREIYVHDAYAGAEAGAVRDVARYQALARAAPEDGEVAEGLALALLDLHQSDWALRVAGAAAARADEATEWRAHFAAASAHARRLEAEDALERTERALEACDGAGAGCPDDWRARIGLFRDQLARGLEAGVDPETEPERFRRETLRTVPTQAERPDGEPADGPAAEDVRD